MDKSNPSDILPRHRVSASNAVASFALQLDSDGRSDLEVVEDVKDKLSPSTRKERAEVKVQYGKKNRPRARASSMKESPTKAKVHYGSSVSDAVLPTSLVVSTSSHRPGPHSADKNGQDLHLAADSPITESDSSDLTSLSSTRSLSPSMTSPIHNELPKPPLCTPSKAVPLTAYPRLEYEQLPELNESAWSTIDLDSYVWVLLEPKSKRIYDPDRDENDCKEMLWWPAKIQSTRNSDVPLKVSLFGPGSKKAEIKIPSVENVLSKLDMIGRPRFNKPTFVSASSVAPHAPMASPRKKLKRDRGDVEKHWEAAVSEMIQDGEEQAGSDHLPDIGEAFNYQFDVTSTATATAPVGLPTNAGKPKSKGKGKRKSTCDSDDEGFWEPPPADGSLDIPGELILGRDRPSKTAAYWPAKIKDYAPPTKRTEEGKYTVIWLDTAEQNIPRDWFYTTDEDGFALCTLGKFESSVPEVLNDGDEDDDEDLRRSLSPVPLDPPPNNEDFSNLSIREQFVYTKTVLHAILNDDYEPTKSKHSRFMTGGKQRASLTDEAALRGRMDPKDVDHLQTYIREWCLREEAPTNIFVEEIENRVGDNSGLGPITDIQEEVKEPFSNPGLVIAGRLRSGSPALTEPDLLSSPYKVPPSSSCPSVTHGREASLTSDDSAIVPDVPPSALESEAPPSSAATDPILSKAGPDLMDMPLIHVKTRPSKQQGCEEYHLLSHFDKIEYCLNVLLPEAVRQVLLWRSGKRTSIQLLSSAEEEDLYQEGQTLLNETDWVFDIMRYRQMMQSKIPKGKTSGTSTSRPKRTLNAPSYVE